MSTWRSCDGHPFEMLVCVEAQLNALYVAIGDVPIDHHLKDLWSLVCGAVHRSAR